MKPHNRRALRQTTIAYVLVFLGLIWNPVALAGKPLLERVVGSAILAGVVAAAFGVAAWLWARLRVTGASQPRLKTDRFEK